MTSGVTGRAHGGAVRNRGATRRRTGEHREALRLVRRALERLEATAEPDSVGAVPGEPAWVARLAPVGRAFARLLLREAGRPAARRSRTQAQARGVWRG